MGGFFVFSTVLFGLFWNGNSAIRCNLFRAYLQANKP